MVFQTEEANMVKIVEMFKSLFYSQICVLFVMTEIEKIEQLLKKIRLHCRKSSGVQNR